MSALSNRSTIYTAPLPQGDPWRCRLGCEHDTLRPHAGMRRPIRPTCLVLFISFYKVSHQKSALGNSFTNADLNLYFHLQASILSGKDSSESELFSQSCELPCLSSDILLEVSSIGIHLHLYLAVLSGASCAGCGGTAIIANTMHYNYFLVFGITTSCRKASIKTHY